MTEWMNESRAFLPQVYDFKYNSINEDYVAKNELVIKKQLLTAGIRMACVLNDIFRK